jgi:hypothetical protein
MTATQLFAALAARGIEMVAESDRLRFRPIDRLTPADWAALRDHKEDLLQLVRSGAAGSAHVRATVNDAENEFYWANLFDKDRAYLLEPRRYPEPCQYCGGRLRHHALCGELKRWELAGLLPQPADRSHAGSDQGCLWDCPAR